jgi:hypothetical protein
VSDGVGWTAEKWAYLHLLGGPHVEIDGLDAADVRAHPAVDARTSYAEIHAAEMHGNEPRTQRHNESSQVPRGPPRVCACMVREEKKEERWCTPLRLQSAQSLLSGCLTSSRRIFALRSVVALSGLYMVGVSKRCYKFVHVFLLLSRATMSSPTARAEARRKAILARGGDRLAKLTTSARGEDAPAYAAPGAAFVDVPPPPPPKDTPRPSPSPDPSVWPEEQQRQFMQALMGGALNPAPPPPSFGTPPAADDPFATMMAQLNRMNPAQGGAAASKAPAPPKPPTRLQKWMPLLHLVCMWCLLAFFVLWKEPQVFVEKTAGAVEVAFWKRWPKLVTQGTLGGAWGVQVAVSSLTMSRSLSLRLAVLLLGVHDAASDAAFVAYIQRTCRSASSHGQRVLTATHYRTKYSRRPYSLSLSHTFHHRCHR